MRRTLLQAVVILQIPGRSCKSSYQCGEDHICGTRIPGSPTFCYPTASCDADAQGTATSQNQQKCACTCPGKETAQDFHEGKGGGGTLCSNFSTVKYLPVSEGSGKHEVFILLMRSWFPLQLLARRDSFDFCRGALLSAPHFLKHLSSVGVRQLAKSCKYLIS